MFMGWRPDSMELSTFPTQAFPAISIIIPTGLFVEIDKLSLKLTGKCKGARIFKAILGGRKEQNWKAYTFQFEYSYKVNNSTVIKTFGAGRKINKQVKGTA